MSELPATELRNARSGKLESFFEMIKFSHSVFALPFAVAAAVLACEPGSLAPPRVWIWILVAIVAARTAAMSYNRIVDRDIDSRNPRTRERELPAGRLSVRFAVFATLMAAGMFILAAGMLNRLALSLSPLVLAWLLGYSHAKRFTILCHVWLGMALGLSPVGAWIAVRGSILDAAVVPVLLAMAVTAWTAGFDIIYSCQDAEVDRAERLHSIPGRMGIRRALWLSSALHLVLVAILLLLPMFAPGLGIAYHLTLAAVAILLIYEHSIVRADDLSRVDVAFFTLNGAVSILLGAVMALDHLF